MAANTDNADLDIVAVGQAVYAEIRGRLEATDNGSFVVIDAGSRDYEVDPHPPAAKRRLLARRPEAKMYETRIGQPKVVKMVSIRPVGGEVRPRGNDVA